MGKFEYCLWLSTLKWTHRFWGNLFMEQSHVFNLLLVTLKARKLGKVFPWIVLTHVPGKLPPRDPSWHWQNLCNFLLFQQSFLKASLLICTISTSGISKKIWLFLGSLYFISWSVSPMNLESHRVCQILIWREADVCLLSSQGPQNLSIYVSDPSILFLLPKIWLIDFCRYAVTWYPIYRIPDSPLSAKFLTYHSFKPRAVEQTCFGVQDDALEGVNLPGSQSSGLCLPLLGLKCAEQRGEPWLEPYNHNPQARREWEVLLQITYCSVMVTSLSTMPSKHKMRICSRVSRKPKRNSVLPIFPYDRRCFIVTQAWSDEK